VSALAVVAPVSAASIFLYKETGIAGVIGLLGRSFDYSRIKAKVWYAPAILLVPCATVLMYVIMRLTGMPLPIPRFPALPALLAMLIVFFVTSLAEEIGWSGYVLELLQVRRSALYAGVLLGLMWGLWHIVSLIQAHRSPVWIAWWFLGTVASRVVMTWLYNNSGRSVFGAALYHDFSNLSWQLFPNFGSHWDPRVNGLILATVAVIVTAAWGPRTLTHSNA
jgi:hypothetical protein